MLKEEGRGKREEGRRKKEEGDNMDSGIDTRSNLPVFPFVSYSPTLLLSHSPPPLLSHSLTPSPPLSHSLSPTLTDGCG
jgi:hypothetical protein